MQVLPSEEAMSKESLRECPFCGGKAVKGICGVWCEKCHATPRNGDNVEEAIAAWNRRVPSEREQLLEKVVEVAKIAVLPYEHPDHDQDAIVHLSIALEAFQIHDDARGEEKI